MILYYFPIVSNFANVSKITNKVRYFMRIVCWQSILMKFHSLFILKISKDVTKFVVCCSRDWPFKGLIILTVLTTAVSRQYLVSHMFWVIK